MANSIALAEKFLPVLDEIYKVASLTARMDGQTKPIDFAGAATVKIFKTSMVGLGNYSRSAGYPKGDVTGVWEALTLTQSRGREFSVDRMDDEETLGQAFGTLVGEFIRTEVAPEVDAFRFAVYATKAGLKVSAGATLTKETVLSAIRAATAAMNAAEVPPEGRLLYVSDSVSSLIDDAIGRQLSTERGVDSRMLTLDGMPIIMVPQTRFYDAITLDAGATANAGGFAKTTTTGKDLNFLIVYPPAVLQATKLALPKIFDPDVNQDLDAWKFQYRLYHDAFVYDNKVKGIYSHFKAA